MNTKQVRTTAKNEHSITTFCMAYGRKLISELQRTKEELVSQFRKAFTGNQRMLRLVLSEAEALAFRTQYPHLVFPSLALEKIERAVAGQRRQQQLRSEQKHEAWTPSNLNHQLTTSHF